MGENGLDGGTCAHTMGDYPGAFLQHTLFFRRVTASDALWKRAETPSYRKKSAHCTWRAIVARERTMLG